MPPGKAAAQAGHAFLEAYLSACECAPREAAAYRADPPGTKVVLSARSLDDLLDLARQAEDEGLPCALITDHGHVLPPHFDGGEVITALGLGPATRDQIDHLTRRYKLVR
jgi:PTH2 family peptidyl-tRNA hydrolase